MPCSQRSTLTNSTGFTINPTSGGYATEADCLNACKEGACCERTTCSVKPACQCQGTGKTFKGVGTVCTELSCCTLFTNGCSPPFTGVALSFPTTITASVSADQDATWPFAPSSLSGSYVLDYVPVQGSNQPPTQCAEYSRFFTVSGRFIDMRSYWFYTLVNNTYTPAMSFLMHGGAFNSYFGFFSFPASGPCVVNSYITATSCFSASADLYQRTVGENQLDAFPCNQTWKKVGTVQVSG
jgi:hypothetical protein